MNDADVGALKAALQLERRKSTLLEADVQRLTESEELIRVRLDFVEARLVLARSAMEASRSRRKEMARVINDREAKLGQLREKLAERERRTPQYTALGPAKRALRRLARAMKRMRGNKA